MCEPLRIDLAKMHEEIGAGFMEACIGAGEGTEPADQLVLLKNFIRALALRQGRSVTFMPRWTREGRQPVHPPSRQPEGQGRSSRCSGTRRRRTAISRTFRHFLGGLQGYMSATSPCSSSRRSTATAASRPAPSRRPA
jgi:glutamine synthetase